MIGDHSKGTETIERRNASEYAMFRILFELRHDYKRRGMAFTANTLTSLRDSWQLANSRRTVDFAYDRPTVSDIERLLRGTGVTSFGELGTSDTLRTGIRKMWGDAVNEYRREAKEGRYLHTISDPEFREHVLDHIDGKKFGVYAVKDRSFRDMSIGDDIELYDMSGNALRHTGTIREGLYNESFVVGWSGAYIDGERYRGLSHIIGAYLTKADVAKLDNTFDPQQMIDIGHAQRALDLLQHFRSQGYDFSVVQSERPNQIDVALTSSNNAEVRILDIEHNGKYTGRVYDAYNQYYLHKDGTIASQNASQYTMEDSRLIVDYVMGRRQGEAKSGRVLKMATADTSRVDFKELRDGRYVRVVPTKGRYDATLFRTKEEAENYIKEGIAYATAYVHEEFKAEEIQALIDDAIERGVVTTPEFQEALEKLYSHDEMVRIEQERAVDMRLHSDEGGLQHLESFRDAIVGDFENGFNPAFVTERMMQTERRNTRNAMLSALKVSEYDLDKIIGNDFAVNALKERAIAFDPETAKTIDEVDNPQLRKAMMVVQQTLYDGGFRGGVSGFDHPTRGVYKANPDVWIDDNGVIRWQGLRRVRGKTAWQEVSGDVGQVIVPDENGIIKTKFKGDNNYAFVPGYTGYFTFEGDYDDRMKRFRVKGFDQHLVERLRAQVTHQMTRPFIEEIGDIPTVLDASSLNGLYHGDVYGKRIELDFLETNQLKPEVKSAILKTLSNRVRFDNQFSDHATTSAETQDNRNLPNIEDTASFSYYKVAGGENMRVLHADIENYADLTMTGTGKTQGLIWYLTDGARVNPDGSVTPSDGMYDEHGERIPDKTALKKLDYFEYEKNNAWDRTQMSANQLMTALRVDEKVNTALMSFGGWTFDDSYVVSKEFAERNQVFGEKPNENSMRLLDDLLRYKSRDEAFDVASFTQSTGMAWSSDVIRDGMALQALTLSDDRQVREKAREDYQAFLEEHGRFRPLQRGDKLSDFGGNKGTIGVVVDRDMPEDVAKKESLEYEVAFFKANPELDVISAPYSMLSRHNAGVVKELMEGEPKDLVDPVTGEVYKATMGQLNLIVTDMVVDDKTHAYTREDVLDGKGRKASGQLAWALQSKDAKGLLNEIYGHNVGAWETFREYLIVTGLDMKPDGTIVKGYQPHYGEEREHFTFDSFVDSHDFLNAIDKQGGFLDLPFEVTFKNGLSTTELPVLSASLRQNVELVDGTMRRNDFTNHYRNIYEAVGEYMDAKTDAEREAAKNTAQKQFDAIQSVVIDRQLNGSHNGKHSYIRDKIMGKRMNHSATGVAIVDPRRKIGEVGMNQEMMDALNANEGDVVMMFRDPVWRDGAIRAMTVVRDDTAHGVAFNPITDKSHDGDFDGDTYGLMKFDSKEANRDLVEKFSHHANIIDKGSGKEELYFQSGMDLASAEAKAEALGDTRPKELMERIQKNANSKDPRVQKQVIQTLDEYTHILFRELSFGADFVSLDSDEAVFDSFKKMVTNKAKGKPAKPAENGKPAQKGSLEVYMDYHNGLKTDEDARDIQYATGVKTDDTGLAGGFSQRLVSVMRNHNITSALEAMYPVTQGTLQVKHDPDHARQVNEVLTDHLNRTFQGRGLGPDGANRQLTPKAFKTQLADILENHLKVDVAEEHIDAVTDLLTHDGQIVPLKEAMKLKGAPMDRVAYSGNGYIELCKLATNGESLLDGEYNKMFAPFAMRYANEKTKIAKKDTQRIAKEEVVTVSTEATDDHEVQATSDTSVEVVMVPDADEGISL